MDSSKYVRYTPEQVEALERVYAECPKPTSLKRHQLIRECSILSNIDPKQIKVWFQNRRCREKQRKEASHLQTVNRKLTAMNKLLMEENDRLQKHVSHLVYDNGYMRQQLHTVNSTTTDTCCESVVVSGQQQQQNPMPQHPQTDATSPAGLLAIAEETLTEFLSKATGTAVDWVQMIGMKPGPESIGIVAVSRNCNGVAARACGLVSLEPMKVAEILKDRPSWHRDCRCLDILNVIPTGNGGTIELIYLQTYAPTTLASARDFWTLRYTRSLEDGSVVVCERSLTSTTGGPVGPSATSSVRAKILPSGFLIRPCEGGGSIVHIVDHIDLNACTVPEVLRPLYESSKILAQKMTMAAFRYIRQIAQETSGEIQYAGGRQPAVLRAFSQRLCRGFNNAVSGFIDDGWTIMVNDGVDDVTIAVNSSPSKFLDAQYNTLAILPTFGGVLCARASMLLQNVCPALLVRFLREHRSEWADYGVDAYSSASLKASPYAVPCARPGVPSSQVILPLAQTVEHEEFLEVVRLEGHAFSPEDIALSRDMYLLQLCSGVEESATGGCAQLVFAHIDESFGDDAPLLPSGFSVIPLEPKSDSPSAARTLDLASTLEARTGGTRPAGEVEGSNYNHRSVLTIAFQFAFENHYRENVAAMARQYVRSIVGSVQRVAMAIAPSQLGSQLTPKSFPGSPEAVTLARWICRSYKDLTGGELLQVDSQAAGDAVLKQLWHHTDSIMCCSVKMNDSAVFSFANQAGLDMLETTLIALQDIMLDKILDEAGRKVLLSEFPKIMQQGFAYLPAGLCVSSMGRPVSYERAVAWKVLNDDNSNHCLAFMFINWVALLAFHLALITDPQGAFVVLTFASVLYHGNWEEGVKFARRHSDAASIYAPEISDSQASISDDELVERVKELAVLVQNSLVILTDKDSLQEAMSKFPGSPCSGLVFISKNMKKVVEVIFDVLIEDVRSLKTRRNSFAIDYTLLGKGQTPETRFVLGKVILDTIAPGVIGSEVIKHTRVKVDAQLSKNATKENMGGNVKFKKRKFVCEDDNQPNASSEIKHNRAEKRKSVIAKQSKEKAVEKPDKESLSQKLDNRDAVTKKKTKVEQNELPPSVTRMVLERVKHEVPPQKQERKGGDKSQQTWVNHLKLLGNVDNGATTKEHSLKEKRDSSQEHNEEKSESLHPTKQDWKAGKLSLDEKSKPKRGKRTLSDLFRR